MQAFTCNAVSNPIFWAGAKPIYVDIDETYNMDPADLKNKISSKTKAVIVQHTFGVPAQIEKIQEICKKNKLILIEDMAHALGSKYQGNYWALSEILLSSVLAETRSFPLFTAACS